MKENLNNKTNNYTVNQWYKSVFSTALVGAVFSFVILVLIFANFVRSNIIEARQEQELVNFKAEILDKPGDEQLIEKIRQRDLRYRQNIIRRRDFNRKGAYLLLGSVVIMLAGFKLAGSIRKRMPEPHPGGDILKEQVRDAVLSRWSVTSALAVLAFGAILLASRPDVVFNQEQSGNITFPTDEEISQNWPRFRGPGGLAICTDANIPENWNGKTEENILWKTEIPLPGKNSPVVWNKKLFLSGGDPNTFSVFCFDTDTGSLLWTGDVTNIFAKSRKAPFDVFEDTGYSASTAATDGRRVYAIFNTGIVACFDFNGNKVWEKDLGIPQSNYGYASSLSMFQNLLLIQYDQGDAEEEKSKMIALDSATSNIVWQAHRNVGGSWTTPVTAKISDSYQLITAGDPWVISYNPANGKELWRADCLGADVAPSPIYAGGLVLVIKPYSKLIAIKPDGFGDVTKTHIVWAINEIVPDICSPVGNDEYVYLLAAGYLSCFKITDGQKMYEQNMGASFKASPSLVGDKLYMLGEEGVMYIAQAGPEYKELAKCELGEKCEASPAFMNGRIYIRGEHNLYCIEKKN